MGLTRADKTPLLRATRRLRATGPLRATRRLRATGPLRATRPRRTAGRSLAATSATALTIVTALLLCLTFAGGSLAATGPRAGTADEPAITQASLDGILRTGEGFLQILRADVEGDLPADVVPVIEPFAQSNPGTIRFSRLELIDDTMITGIARQASAPGTYFLTLCLAPEATPTCADTVAVASRVFSIDVAGPPTQVRLTPREYRSDAGEAVSLSIAILDASGQRTQLSSQESLGVEATAQRGSVGVNGVAKAIERIRDGLGGSIEAAVVWPGDRATITLTAIGFDAEPDRSIVETRALPGSVVVLPESTVVLAATSATASIRGRVVDAAGDALAGVTVAAVVTGATSTSTTTDVTGDSGWFRITYATADASTGSQDSVAISADAGVQGIGTADVSVVLSANGRTPIRDLRLNDIPAPLMEDPTPVVYDGYAIGGVDAVRVTARADVPGAEVVIRSTRGWLAETDGAAWNAGHHQVQITSDPVSGLATAYLFTTTPTNADVAVIGATTMTARATFRTRPPAARNLHLTSSSRTMRTGQQVRLMVLVTDVFGTPVPEAAVDLAVAGVGAFDTGTRRLTSVTDVRGRVEVFASASTAGTMVITATGNAARCVRGENQYLCPRNEPAPGFAAAGGPASAKVTVTPFRPTVRVVAPTMNQRVSYNEWLRLRAVTTDIRPGMRAQLRSGRRVLANSTVAANGRLDFPPVHAQGRGTLTVAVGGITTTTQVSVVDFGISSVRRSQGSLILGVVTGVWQPPTRISLTRNGTVVSTQRVVARGRPMSFTVPQRRGNYQVRVTSRFGTVLGRASRFVP